MGKTESSPQVLTLNDSGMMGEKNGLAGLTLLGAAVRQSTIIARDNLKYVHDSSEFYDICGNNPELFGKSLCLEVASLTKTREGDFRHAS